MKDWFKANGELTLKLILGAVFLLGLVYVLQMEEIRLYEKSDALANFQIQGIPLGKRLKIDGPFAAAFLLLMVFFIWRVVIPYARARLGGNKHAQVMRPMRYFMAGLMALLFGLFFYSYFNYRIERRPFQTLQTQDRIAAMAFNQDGSRLATSDSNGNAYIMDNDGRHKLTIPPTYPQNLQAVAYSPFGDMLAVGDSDGNILLWNAEGTTFKRQLLGGHGAVSQLAMGLWPEADAGGASINKIVLVAGFVSGDVAVWKIKRDGSDAVLMLDQTRAHALKVTALTLDASSRFLATGGADYQIRLFDLARQRLVYDFEGQPYSIMALEFMPLDGNRVRLSVVSEHGKVDSWVFNPTQINWNKNIVSEVPHYLSRVDGRPDVMNLTAAGFSPAAQIYATAEGADAFNPANAAVQGRVFLRDYPIGCRYDLLELPSRVTRVLFDPSGNYLVTGETSGQVRIFPLTRVNQTEYDARNKIACPSIASSRLKYKIQAHPQAFDLNAATSDTVNDIQALAWNRNSARPMVAAVDSKRVVHICVAFDFQQPAECHPLRGARDDIVQLGFMPTQAAQTARANSQADSDAATQAEELITLSREGAARKWVLSGKSAFLQRELIWNDAAISAMAINPKLPLVALGNADGTLRLWNTNKSEYADTRQHTNEISALAFSADGKQMASGDTQGNVYLWQFDPDKPKAWLAWVFRPDAAARAENAHPLRITALSFAPNGAYLVSAGVIFENPRANAKPQPTVRVWQTQPDYKLMREFQASGIQFTNLIIAADNRHFVGAGDDENLYLFDIQDGASQPKPIETLSRNIMAVALNAEHQIVTAAPDGSLIQQYLSVDMDELTQPGLRSPLEEWIMRAPTSRLLFALFIPAIFFAGLFWFRFYGTNKEIAAFHFAAQPEVNPRLAQQYVANVREGKPLLALAVRNNKIENIGSSASPKQGGPGVLTVDEGYAAVLERGGRISRVVGAGVFFLEQGEIVTMPVALYARSLTINVKNVLTRDQMRFEKITVVARHCVQGACDFAAHGTKPSDAKTKNFELLEAIIRSKIWTPEHSDYTKTIEAYVTSQVRDLAGEEYFEDLYVGGVGARKTLIRTLRERVSNKMRAQGIEIESLNITEIELEERMVKALQDRKHAELDRQVKIARAQTRRDAIIIQQDAKTALRDALLRQIADPLRDKNRGVILDSEIAVRYIEAIERLSLNFIQDDLWNLKKDEAIEGTVVERALPNSTQANAPPGTPPQAEAFDSP